MPEHFYFRIEHTNLHKRMHQCRALHIMAGIMMLIYSLTFFSQEKVQWITIIAIIPPALLVLFLAIFKKNLITDINNNRIFRILEAGILLMGSMGYLKHDQVFPAILFGVVALLLVYVLYLESRLFSHQYIDITAAGITIALPTHDKKASWQEVRNIVVRDRYLTVETTSEKIWQYPIFNSLTPEEFEAFLLFCERYKSGGAK